MSEVDLAAMRDRLLVIGASGHVAAIDKATGTEIWRASLERTGWQLVSMLIEDGIVYAASAGRLFALDQDTGRVLWRNDLRGLGYGSVTMATSRTQPDVHAQPLAAAAAHAAARQAQASSTST